MFRPGVEFVFDLVIHQVKLLLEGFHNCYCAKVTCLCYHADNIQLIAPYNIGCCHCHVSIHVFYAIVTLKVVNCYHRSYHIKQAIKLLPDVCLLKKMHL